MIWHKLVIHLVVHVLFLMQVLFDVLALWILEGLHLIVAFLILHHLIHRVFIAIIFVRLLLVFHGFILLLEVVSLGHLFVLLLRLALLAGLLVRLWRVDFAWHPDLRFLSVEKGHSIFPSRIPGMPYCQGATISAEIGLEHRFAQFRFRIEYFLGSPR